MILQSDHQLRAQLHDGGLLGCVFDASHTLAKRRFFIPFAPSTTGGNAWR
jgi:hypothetical protein